MKLTRFQIIKTNIRGISVEQFLRERKQIGEIVIKWVDINIDSTAAMEQITNILSETHPQQKEQ